MKPLKNKYLRVLLYPHPAFLLAFIPVSFAFLIFSFVFIDELSPISYVSYALSAYSLLTLSLRIPALIRYIKAFKAENSLIKRLESDPRLRVKISLYGALIFNTAYAILQLGLGFYHASMWYYAMSAYYVLLALIRFFLLRYTRTFEPTASIRSELIRYALSGIVLLIMNITLAAIIFIMVSRDISFVQNEITTIVLAAYTFAAFTIAIVNTVKYRKYKSPVFSASKIISLTAAAVSMLTLEATMLSTFGTQDTQDFNSLMLILSGTAIFIFVGFMALYMIIGAYKKLKQSTEEKINDPEQ